MQRRGSILAALVLGLSAVWLQAVALPGRVVACSCMPPSPLAEIVTQADVSVVVATPGAPLAEVTPLTVGAWYHGNDPVDAIWLRGGTGMASSCDVFLTVGQAYLLVLYSEGGLYSTNSCAPNAQLGTPEGDRLLAEAEAAFGAPQPPPSPEPEAESVATPSPWLGDGLLWVFAGVGGAVVLFVVVLVAAGARRQLR
jgi:hypothetical protein